MSDAVSPLGGATYDGFARVSEIGPVGMITLRAAAGTKGLAAAIKAAVGLALPATRDITVQGDRAVGWMSPDEHLLILPYADIAKALDALGKKLAGTHYLAVDVSDARAVFRIDGPKAAQVIAKLCPVDLDALGPHELRRTRAAQVACALWRDDVGFTLICFRSVAQYVMDLLENAAQPGSELA